MNKENLLIKAKELIESQSTAHDGQELILKMGASPQPETLDELRNRIPALAKEGRSKEIGRYVRVLDYYQAQPDIRRFLHFFAQSEAVRGKSFQNIAQAFALANEIDAVQ